MLSDLLKYLTRNNVLSALLLIYLAIGLVIVATTSLDILGLMAILNGIAVSYGIGVGLASIKFTRALPGEQLLGIFGLIVLAVAVVAGIEVITGNEPSLAAYETYIAGMTPWIAGLAIGKGLHAHNTPAD